MIYRFGDCELDTVRVEIRRDGEPQHVEPQVYDVLAHLVTHPDRLITKEELLDEVWGDRFVSESALTSRLKTARRVVGDDGQSQAVIRTVRGRGYRFVAPVTEVSEDAAVPVGATRVRVAGPAAAPSSVPLAATPPSDRGHDWALVGRNQELETLARWFADPSVGGVLIVGPAGSGKTRLADEGADLAAAAGVPTLRAAGHAEAQPIPLAALAHLLPPEVTHPPGAEVELDRAALFHGARAALEKLAAGGRLLLHVDDVDQLDDVSAALVASLCRTSSLFIVMTMREGASAPSGIDAVAAGGPVRRMDLAPLGVETLDALLHRALGGPVAASTLDVLATASGGNPGILRHLVLSSLEAGSLVESAGVWRLVGPLGRSPSLEELVGDRLAGLDDESRRAVELLAISGRVGLAIAADLVDESVLEDLDRRGLVAARHDRRRTEIELAHPLFGEVVRNGLGPLVGRRLRRQLADAVDEHEARRREDRLRVVSWRLDGGGDLDHDAVIDAARLALLARDELLGERLAERAMADRFSADAVQVLAEIHYRRGEHERVEELLRGVDLTGLSDTERAVLVRRRANNLFYGPGDYDGAVAMLREVLNTLADPDAVALVTAHIVMLLATSGRVTKAIHCSEQVDVTSGTGAAVELLRARALALAAAGRGEAALEVVAAALDAHDALPADLGRPGRSMLHFGRLLALTELGRIRDALRLSASTASLSSAESGGIWRRFGTARVGLLAGDPRLVVDTIDTVVRRSEALQMGPTERWALALRAHAHLLLGEVPRAADELARVAELEDGGRGLFHQDIDRAHAWCAAETDGPDAAVAMLLASADDAAALGKFAFEGTLRHDVVRLGRPGEVVQRLDELAAQSDGALPPLRAAHARAAADRDAVALRRVAQGLRRIGALGLAGEVEGTTPVGRA